MSDKLPSELYAEGLSDRNPYETRAKEIAKISLPRVIREDGSNGGEELGDTVSQSFNGRLVNNLKSKIGMALLPPSTSSFKLKPDAEAMETLFGENPDEKAREALYQKLSGSTDVINTEIENQQIRSSLFDMLTQMIIVGSCVVEKIPKSEGGGINVFPLKTFVVKLDSKGKPVMMVVKEVLVTLPEGVKADETKEEWEMFTLLEMVEGGSWEMSQEIDGDLTGESSTFSDYDKLPFRYFGWEWLQGDTYHRGFAEDYYADMKQIDALAKLNTQGAVIAAKSLILVNQRGGRTRKDVIANSINGAVVDGVADDITAFQLQKGHDFQISNDREKEIKRELQQCFLDSGSVARDAERVTAEEIRVMAQQLESSSLAGVYSKMSLDWSKWIVEQVMDEVGIKFDAIEVNVLTGLDALGRSQESGKLDKFVERVMALQLNGYVHERELLNRYAGFDGISTIGLLKTTEEVAKARQEAADAQAKQAMAESAGVAAGQEGGKRMAEKAIQ